MANLGYFQLKASPGAWTLRLRDGRSADIYSIQRCVLVVDVMATGVMVTVVTAVNMEVRVWTVEKEC